MQEVRFNWNMVTLNKYLWNEQMVSTFSNPFPFSQ